MALFFGVFRVFRICVYLRTSADEYIKYPQMTQMNADTKATERATYMIVRGVSGFAGLG